MTKSALAVAVGIFMTGLVAGMLFVVGVQTGVSPDEGSISLMILKSFCQATEGLGGATFNCWGYVAVVAVLIVGVGIAEILATAATIGDWRIGLTLYGIGWLVGLMMILGG